MNPTLDQLTAYALGEGTPDERASLVAYLATHPEAQAEVAAIQETAALIGRSLASETTPGLDAERRMALANLADAAAVPAGTTAKVVRFPHLVVWPGLVAAGLAVTVMTLENTSPVRQTLAEQEAVPMALHQEMSVAIAPASATAPAKPQPAPVSAPTSGSLTVGRSEQQQALAGSAPRPSVAVLTPSAPLAVAIKSDATEVAAEKVLEAPNGIDPVAVAPVAALFARSTDRGSRNERSPDTLGFPGQAADMSTRKSARGTATGTSKFAPDAKYPAFAANGWHRLTSAGDDANRLSPLGADVETASYADVRRFLRSSQLPPADAVRSEELINAFHYHYAPPTTRSVPFAVHPQVAACPWAEFHRLVRIGLKGYELERSQRPPANLVFLVDVNASMNAPTKLPLVQWALRLLTTQLRTDDRVSIVTYAGKAGVLLDSTPGENQTKILAAIDHLGASGSTSGAGGIAAAYDQAQRGFIRGGVNRVVLCTDGDINVGAGSRAAWEELITQRAKSGVFLTTLGFGMGNHQDPTMQILAERGNGTYASIDSAAAARKHLVEGCIGTLVTIAKDVKIQVEFNPAQVASWRLIGYEKRALAHQNFLNDRKDAGEIGAGHTVTALYEIEPLGGGVPGGPALRDPETTVQAFAPTAASAVRSAELLTVSLRWKLPDSDVSSEISVPVPDATGAGDEDLRFAAAVAEFSLSLRDPAGTWDLQRVLKVAQDTAGNDPQRLEFVDLVRTTQQLRR
jgi:Ca-activated chloride channel homolog